MKQQTKKINTTNGWYISYSPYSDLFQIYDMKALSTPRAETIEKKKTNFRGLYLKSTNKLILFEIKQAYDVLGVDIDSLSRPAIIKTITPYMEQYAR